MRHVHLFVVLGLALVGCATATDAGVNTSGTGGGAGSTGNGGAASTGGSSSGGSATGGAATGSATGSGGEGGALGSGGNGGSVSTTGGSGNTGGTTGGTGGTTGGTGGTTGGTGGTTGGTGGVGGAAPTTGISIKDQNEHSADATTAFGSQIFLYNDSTSDVALDTITIYYYFTVENIVTPLANINWGNYIKVPGGQQYDIPSNITIAVQTYSPTKTNADHYAVFGFNGGLTLKVGCRAQLSWTIQDYESKNFTQSNDYSYANYSSPTQWDHIVVKQGSTILWGVDP